MVMKESPPCWDSTVYVPIPLGVGSVRPQGCPAAHRATSAGDGTVKNTEVTDAVPVTAPALATRVYVPGALTLRSPNLATPSTSSRCVVPLRAPGPPPGASAIVTVPVADRPAPSRTLTAMGGSDRN